MELLNTNLTIIHNIEKQKIISSLINAKKNLHNLGIAYIDWRLDNVGIDEYGNVKIYDFDCSGIFDVINNKWIIKPLLLNNFKKTLNKNLLYPIDIDNYLFNEEIIKKMIN